MTENKKIRVYATCNIGDNALNILREKGYKLEVYPEITPPPKELIIEKIKSGVDALITTLRDPIDEDVLEAGKGILKVVAQYAVGFDNIDRAAANEARIPFSNTAEVLTEATAEFAFSILICVSRKLYPSEKLVNENRWTTWHPYLPFLGNEVTGKTVSVIGTGRIGKAFIKKCDGFDMNVLCYDPVSQDDEFVKNIQKVMDLRFEVGLCVERKSIKYVSFDEAISGGDYVSLHVPLLRDGDFSTYHLMNEENFNKMKRTAYLINTSRGPVVDEQALHDALIDEKIAGAALDVFDVEPLPADSPLRDERLELKLRKFHHFASGTLETRLSTDPDKGMAGRTVQALIDVLEGNYDGDITRMPYIVNKEAFQ